MDTVDMIGFEPHIYVDVSGFVELKRAMLLCHKSQLARGGNADFAPLEELLIRQCTARGAQAGVGAAEGFQQHLAWKRIAAW
jgi:LmbE family N-acetylglucosaminyl deacetylase